jgi:glycosyltransferase involved in cell wall biosynthesis
MGFPTVTVIIPTFNRAAWLPETVRSVLSQTVAPLEILIVDDGSTDDTEAVCGQFTEPVRYIRQDNAGVGAARNRGAAEARGEWLAFLDSDDLWTPDKLEVQLAALAATGAAWSITGCVMMDLDGRTLRGTQGFQRAFPLFKDIAVAPDEFFARHFAVGEVTAAGQSHRVFHGDAYVPLFHGNFASPATAMVRRQLFADTGGFDPSLRFAEETEFFHRLSARGPAVVVMSPLLRWRVGQAVSLISSTNTGVLIRNALLSLERAAEIRAPLDDHAREAYLAGRRSLLYRLAYWQLSVLDPAGARATLREAGRAGAGIASPRSLGIGIVSWLPRSVLRQVYAIRRWLRR